MQDALPAHRQAFAPQWQTTAEEGEKHTSATTEQTEHYYNQHARPLPEIIIGSNIAIQNTSMRLWDIHGIVTVIGPHRHYFIKTASGHVLGRNCCYLRHCIPITSPTIVTETPHLESLQKKSSTVNQSPPLPPTQLAPTTGTSVSLEVPWHSKRLHKKPSHLIEEM